MSFLTLGFFTGLSLILAIGAQNLFVIEQGLKKQFVFIVCLICAVSDFLLIFLGIFLFHEEMRQLFSFNLPRGPLRNSRLLYKEPHTAIADQLRRVVRHLHAGRKGKKSMPE